jgi:hypothetical protein
MYIHIWDGGVEKQNKNVVWGPHTCIQHENDNWSVLFLMHIIKSFIKRKGHEECDFFLLFFNTRENNGDLCVHSTWKDVSYLIHKMYVSTIEFDSIWRVQFSPLLCLFFSYSSFLDVYRLFLFYFYKIAHCRELCWVE